ncbi:MAG: hypothetical protein NXH95_01255 [Pseudomonadaceae bacterium]|nr:hypothetical protein [Pseudomonadaceae bacterium]
MTKSETLHETALNIDSMLSVVEEHLHRVVGGDVVPKDAPYHQGLVMMVEQSRRNAVALHDALCESRSDQWMNLTSEQRELLNDLVGNMADGDVNPEHVKCADSARMALAKLENKAAAMTVEECIGFLERSLMDVESHGDDGFKVTNFYTLKGLRHLVAITKLNDSIYCNVDRDAWNRGESLTEKPRAS